jgi:hypothetical protein
VERRRSLTSWVLWLSAALFLVLFVLAVVRVEIVAAFGWLGLLLGEALAASGATERSRMISYVAVGCFVAGIVLLGWFALEPFGSRERPLP